MSNAFRIPRPHGASLVVALALAVPLFFLAVFFLWPVVAMLARGLVTPAGVDTAGFAAELTRPRTWKVAGQTLWMAAASTAFSVMLGLPLAYVLYRLRLPGVRVVRAFVVVPFVLPTVVVGTAFRALLRADGPYGFLGWDSSPWAVVAAMVFFNTAVISRTVGPLWAALPPHAEAARTLGASPWRAFRTVTLVELAPAITSGAAIVFLFCSTSFGIVQTLGAPGYGTLETEIWVQTTTFLDLRAAAVLSLLQVVIVGIATAVAARATRRTSAALRLRPAARRKVSRSDIPALLISAATVIFLIGAPLLTLVARSFQRSGTWTLENYRNLIGSSGFSGVSASDALRNSLTTGLSAAALALLLGALLAFALASPWAPPRPVSAAAEGIALLPLGVSAVTVGFGLFLTIRMLVPSAQVLVPVAQAVVALPLVARVILPVVRAIDPRLREAAATLGAGPGRVWRSIDLPLAARALAVAAGFGLAISLGEYGATSFLATSDSTTLPVLIGQLLGRPGAENYGTAMAGAVMLGTVTGGLMALSEMAAPAGAASSLLTQQKGKLRVRTS
ncbi:MULTISPECIES: ABC transporter permease [Actinotignum]|uniref:ABC transporter permease n=1 Tax=Actinotignum TaxID=1653174 RepID=UPI00254D8959|nr:ABC transporter permease subunit [Actinotignum timonense]MDK6927619.1 ABC transporter permease subunit [Actinotignum timonense]